MLNKMKQNCKNCNELFTGSYCNTCGLPANLKRIDKHYVSHEIFHLFHFEKGFFYTVKEMIFRPGESAREFINENRSRLMKPVAFLILTALIFTLTAYLTHSDKFINDQLNVLNKISNVYAKIINWLVIHHNYGNLVSGFFTALSCKLLYRKYKYNFFEIIIMLCFVIGLNTLLLSVGNLFFGITKSQVINSIVAIVAFVYTTWAIRQFYFNGTKKVGSYFKALFAYVFGQSLMHVFFIAVGITADLIIKLFQH
jgi:hypothetical protein